MFARTPLAVHITWWRYQFDLLCSRLTLSRAQYGFLLFCENRRLQVRVSIFPRGFERLPLFAYPSYLVSSSAGVDVSYLRS